MPARNAKVRGRCKTGAYIQIPTNKCFTSKENSNAMCTKYAGSYKDVSWKCVPVNHSDVTAKVKVRSHDVDICFDIITHCRTHVLPNFS